MIYNPDATLNSMTTTAGTYDATTNWLGSVTGLVNSSGTQVSSTVYTPYGTPTTTGTPASPVGYAGSYSLPGSGGLDDMNARDYNPATSTFTSTDPLLAITGQPYAYASDSPVAQTDPSGECTGWFFCGIVNDTIVGAKLIGALAKYWYNTSCGGPDSAVVLTPYELATQIAEQWGGTVTPASSDGDKVLIPYRNRGIMVRVMEGDGGYYRISIPGQRAFNVSGEATVDRAETHIPIGESSPDDISAIIEEILGDL